MSDSINNPIKSAEEFWESRVKRDIGAIKERFGKNITINVNDENEDYAYIYMDGHFITLCRNRNSEIETVLSAVYSVLYLNRLESLGVYN